MAKNHIDKSLFLFYVLMSKIGMRKLPQYKKKWHMRISKIFNLILIFVTKMSINKYTRSSMRMKGIFIFSSLFAKKAATLQKDVVLE